MIPLCFVLRRLAKSSSETQILTHTLRGNEDIQLLFRIYDLMSFLIAQKLKKFLMENLIFFCSDC